MPPKKPPTAATPRIRKRAPKKIVSANPWAQIDILGILKTLEQSILGEGTLTPAQVTVALALLKKALPDFPSDAAPTNDATTAHEDALSALDDHLA